MVSVNLIGERSNRALTLLAETLQVPLARIPGVDEAEIVGELTREFQVALDPVKLAVHGVTFEEVAAALADANLVIPAGDYADDSGEFVVRVDERFRSRDQVVSTVVRRDADGSFITVEDLIASAETVLPRSARNQLGQRARHGRRSTHEERRQQCARDHARGRGRSSPRRARGSPRRASSWC